MGWRISKLWKVALPLLQAAEGAPARIELKTDRMKGGILMVCGKRVLTLGGVHFFVLGVPLVGSFILLLLNSSSLEVGWCTSVFFIVFSVCISGQLQNTRIRVDTGRNLHCSYGLSNSAAADRLLVATPAAGRALQYCWSPSGVNSITLSRILETTVGIHLGIEPTNSSPLPLPPA